MENNNFNNQKTVKNNEILQEYNKLEKELIEYK